MAAGRYPAIGTSDQSNVTQECGGSVAGNAILTGTPIMIVRLPLVWSLSH